jgi:hypothetical protein
MKKAIVIFKLILLFILSINYSGAQVFTGSTKTVKMSMEPQYELTELPNLWFELDFIDENNNKILEAEESGKVILEIINKGAGPAQGIEVEVETDIYDEHLKIGDKVFIHSIPAGETKRVEIPIEAGFNIQTNQHTLKITAKEHFGFDMPPAFLKYLQTYEFQKAKLHFAFMDIFDTGEGTSTIHPDGLLQTGEQIKARIVIQNIGQNIAKGINYKFETNDQNIFFRNNTHIGKLPDMKINETKEIWVTLAVNKRVDYKDDLPIFLTITEERGLGCIKEFQLPLAIDKTPPSQQNLITVTPDIDKLQSEIDIISTSDRISPRISIKSLDAIPFVSMKRPDAVAVVIGVEQYKNIPSAPYAKRDAEIMTKYFQDVLGIDRVLTYTDKDVSGFFFMNTFDPQTGELQKYVNKGKTEVYVYYSGHGMPEKDGKDVYLFPHDGRTEKLEVMGYSLNTLYKNLDLLEAGSVTVILDACFSGSSRPSNVHIAENISQTKGVRIRPREEQPWESNPNFRLFTSSKDEQTSVGFDETGTGLFTYYLAVGLQGEADLNEDKVITAAELRQYVTEKVSETSKKIRGEQTPQFFGRDDFVLVEF